jgi:hypothetical protein
MSYQISFSLRLEFKGHKTVLAEILDAVQHFLCFNPKKTERQHLLLSRFTSLRRWGPPRCVEAFVTAYPSQRRSAVATTHNHRDKLCQLYIGEGKASVAKASIPPTMPFVTSTSFSPLIYIQLQRTNH